MKTLFFNPLDQNDKYFSTEFASEMDDKFIKPLAERNIEFKANYSVAHEELNCGIHTFVFQLPEDYNAGAILSITDGEDETGWTKGTFDRDILYIHYYFNI